MINQQYDNMLGGYGAPPDVEHVWTAAGTMVIARFPLETLAARKQQAVLQGQTMAQQYGTNNSTTTPR